MTITLELSPELEMRLRAEATRRGLSMEDCAVALIMEALDMMENSEADQASEDSQREIKA